MDWNKFMSQWDVFHRNIILPFIRKSNKETRRKINILLSDMKSSMKWCRLEDCVNICNKLREIINSK